MYISATPEELKRLENQAIKYKEDGDDRLYIALHTPMYKTKYSYFTTNSFILSASLYGGMEFLISQLHTFSKLFFIKNNDNFLAFLEYRENKNDLKIISDLLLFDFNIDDLNNSAFKNTLDLLNPLFDHYKEINFSTYLKDENIVSAYKEYNREHNGTEQVIEGRKILFKIPVNNKET
jgi:hypothetical protein